MESLIAVVADFRSRIGLDLEVSGRAIVEHEEIIQAIKMRDRKRASALLEKHLTYVSVVLEDSSIGKRTGKKGVRR
jgi:DNA-binding GntR family transcriptional regulator